MQKGIPSIQKTEWRLRFEKIRASIPKERRIEASLALLDRIPRGKILSFYSFGSEIELSPLNQMLADQKRLLLPKIEGGEIVPYQIDQLNHTVKAPFYNLLEPNPDVCKRSSEFDTILVPGLVFDRSRYRLGYGKGFYDQFLAKFRKIRSIGVGFKEQLSEELIPRDSWDIPVNELLLV